MLISHIANNVRCEVQCLCVFFFTTICYNKTWNGTNGICFRFRFKRNAHVYSLIEVDAYVWMDRVTACHVHLWVEMALMKHWMCQHGPIYIINLGWTAIQYVIRQPEERIIKNAECKNRRDFKISIHTKYRLGVYVNYKRTHISYTLVLVLWNVYIPLWLTKISVISTDMSNGWNVNKIRMPSIQFTNNPGVLYGIIN